MFKINWINVKSALVYGILTAFFVFILSLLGSIMKAGSIFGLNWKEILDIGVMSTLSIFVTTISLIKNLFTTDAGNFLGITKVIPPIE